MTEDELLAEMWRQVEQAIPIVEPPIVGVEWNSTMYAEKYGLTVKASAHKLDDLVDRGVLVSRIVEHRRWYRVKKDPAG